MAVTSDDVIWQLISQGFCSFKAKIETTTFCRNPHNATGLCNRTSCPLANARYATIMEKEGKCYLFMKTVERAHTPNRLWEEVLLPNNYKQALEMIDQQLQYWPHKMIHRAKQRLTKIWQYLIRMRRLRKTVRTKLVTINSKVEKREKIRERKALAAAGIENQIKKELMDRLKQGTYGEIYNFNQSAFEEVMNEQAIEDEAMAEDEFVEDYGEDAEDLEDLMRDGGYDDGDLDDFGSDDDEDEAGLDEEGSEEPKNASPKASRAAAAATTDSDEEDGRKAAGSSRKRPPPSKKSSQAKRPKRTHVNIEVEEETEPATTSTATR